MDHSPSQPPSTHRIALIRSRGVTCTPACGASVACQLRGDTQTTAVSPRIRTLSTPTAWRQARAAVSWAIRSARARKSLPSGASAAQAATTARRTVVRRRRGLLPRLEWSNALGVQLRKHCRRVCGNNDDAFALFGRCGCLSSGWRRCRSSVAATTSETGSRAPPREGRASWVRLEARCVSRVHAELQARLIMSRRRRGVH